MTPFMQMQVLEFHSKYNQPIGDKPQLLTSGRAYLRAKLIREELDEYLKACSDHNIVECADALGDLLYVVYGAAIEHGFDMGPIVTEIHKSNLSKLGSDGKPVYDEHGKVLKGPNYVPPNLKGVLGL